MIYGFLTLLSYALTYYVVGLLLNGQLADIAEGLRHRPDAPPPGEYLRAVHVRMRQAQKHYTLIAGTPLAALACLVVHWLA